MPTSEHALDVIANAPAIEVGDVQPNPKKAPKSFEDYSAPDMTSLAGTAERQTADVSEPRQYTPTEEDESYGFWEGTYEGARTGIIGTYARKLQARLLDDEGSITDLNNDYAPDDEDIQKVIDSGLPEGYIKMLMDGAGNKESFNSNLTIALSNWETEKTTNQSGILGNVGGAVGDMVSDPLSFVPAVGAVGKGYKIVNNGLVRSMASNALTSGVSEAFLRNQVTGKEADVTTAVGAAVVFSGALYGAGRLANNVMMNRIDASESAINSGKVDPTVNQAHDGTSKVIDDGDGGQIEITESGKAFTAGTVPPKASADLRPDWLEDLATAAGKAESPELRDLAGMFSRPTQGYQGEFAPQAPTAEQIHRAVSARDNAFIADIGDAVDEIVDRHILMGGKTQQRQDVFRRVVDHIEGNPMQKPLSAQELKIAEAIQKQLSDRAELLLDPSRLSGKASPSIHENFIKGQTYVPRVYDNVKMNKLRAAHGDDAIQKAVADSWKDAYAKATNKAELDAIILKDFEGKTEVTPEMLDDYTKRKAFGVVNGDDMTRADLFSDAQVGGARTPDYFKHRVPFTTHGAATLPDGSGFTIADVLDYNMDTILASYNRSTAGQLSAVSATGKSLSDLEKEIAKLKAGKLGSDLRAATALEEQLKVYKGESRTGQYSMGDLIGDTFRDSSFAASNAMMHVGNIFEILSNVTTRPMVVALATKHFAKALGSDLASVVGMGPKKLEKTFADVVVGNSIAKRMNLSYADWADGMAKRMGMAYSEVGAGTKTAMAARYGAMKIAEKSPFTYLLNKTQEAIVKTGNETGLSELLAHANGRGVSSLVSDKFLASNGISRADADAALSVLKGVDPKNFQGLSMNDPRWTHVTRILNAFNDELIMKTDGVGQQFYKPMGVMGRMLMQFKRFATTSSQYAVKTVKDVVELQRFDRFMFFVGGLFSASVAYPAVTAIKSLGMNPDKRKQYLQDELSTDKLVVGALKRSPLLAWPSLAYDTLGGFVGAPYAGLSKTTYETMGIADTKGATAMSTQELIGRAADHAFAMAPAVRPAANLAAATRNLGMLGLDLLDDKTIRSHQEHNVKRQFAKNIQGMLPNDPVVTRPLYAKMWEMLGVDLDKK